MTNRQPQSRVELDQHLQDHLGFLQASADAYDAGFRGEAKRLAVSIRVLVHDTNDSKSLLGQLGQKNTQFIDSAFAVVIGNQNTHSGLVMTSLSSSKGAKYVACLDNVPHGKMRAVEFDSWWTSTVFIDDNKNSLSRKGLVLAVANQDGGAHVDPLLNQVYADLSRNNSLGWVFSDGTIAQPLEGPERAAIRQIAHEVLKSLIPGYTKMPSYPPDGMVVGGYVLLHGAEARARVAALNRQSTRVGRNEPCPCGSTKKYKKCCGVVV